MEKDDNNLLKKKYWEPVKYEIPMVIIGIALICLGAIWGSHIHKKILPSLNGTYVGVPGMPEESNAESSDSIIITYDNNVRLYRKFYYADSYGNSHYVVICADEGNCEERIRQFRVKFDGLSMKYLTTYTPQNEKGREIAPRKFMDKKLFIPKNAIKSNSIDIKFKRGVNKDWRKIPFTKK